MKPRPDSWMPIYIGDYLADTGHLNAAQHGAYLMLLFAYWRLGRALPDDDKLLARWAKMSPKQWKANKEIIGAFFDRSGGEWVQHRAESELSKATEKSHKAATAADAKWRKYNNNGHADAGSKQCLGPAPQPSPIIYKKNGKSEAIGGGPLDTSDGGPMAALAAENRRRHKAGLGPMDAKELAAWRQAH